LTSIIVVPGVPAPTLEEQTCPHFPNFIESCYALPDAALTVWIFNHGVTPYTQACWDRFYKAGDELLEHMLNVVEQEPDVSFYHCAAIEQC
jgi:hypothetical protein